MAVFRTLYGDGSEGGSGPVDVGVVEGDEGGGADSEDEVAELKRSRVSKGDRIGRRNARWRKEPSS